MAYSGIRILLYFSAIYAAMIILYDCNQYKLVAIIRMIIAAYIALSLLYADMHALSELITDM